MWPTQFSSQNEKKTDRYYVSEVLADAETHYSHPQKLLYALLITSRKLHHYF
jgi:hypothetical protein